MIIASIDMGTNTIRLLIAKKCKDCEFKYLYQDSQIARIGEGFGKSKIISKSALIRTERILLEYKNKILSYKVDKVFVVATSAVRESENGKWFVDLIRKETGFNIEVINSDYEAYLTQKGITYSLKEKVKNLKWCAFDLGGGSTEFILSKSEKLIDSFSIPLGVVKLLEKFIKNDPPCIDELESVRKFFVESLKSSINSKFKDIDLLVGNAGTVTSIAAIDMKIDKYSYEKTEGYLINKSSIENILDELLETDGIERLKKFPILKKGREDVITIGVFIVLAIMELFNKNEIMVTNGSLREGILIEHAC